MIASLFDELRDHIAELDKKFLLPYIPAKPSHRPQDYQHDVKAACILAHAAFEGFVEAVSMAIMKHATESWMNQRNSNDSLLSLCLYHGVSIKIEEEEHKDQKRFFDLLRDAIDEAKKLHSKLINENHGFSLKYLRSTLIPIAINPTSDQFLIDSLNKLAAARGSFAHTAAKNALFDQGKIRGRNQQQMAPEDALKVIDDCLEICNLIGVAALKISPESVKKTHVSLSKKISNRRSSHGKIWHISDM